jgi:hypothetical protein
VQLVVLCIFNSINDDKQPLCSQGPKGKAGGNQVRIIAVDAPLIDCGVQGCQPAPVTHRSHRHSSSYFCKTAQRKWLKGRFSPHPSRRQQQTQVIISWRWIQPVLYRGPLHTLDQFFITPPHLLFVQKTRSITCRI